MENVYSNPEFNSQVNDFGDEYHQPDPVIDIEDKEMLEQIKSLKRRYRDFGEYCDAMDLFDAYIRQIVDRYGGKKQFRLFNQLGMVKEYIPFVPTLRRTKTNKLYIDKGLPRVQTDRLDTSHIELPSIDETEDVDVSFKLKDQKDKIFDSKVKDSTRNKVAQDIEQIERFYKGKVKHPTRLSKKVQKERILRQKFLKDDYVPVSKLEEEYYHRKDLGQYEIIDPDALVYYKGVTIGKLEAEELETRDILNELGFNLGINALGKKSRKVVKKAKKKSKKEKKKKKKEVKMSKKYMESFSKGNVQTFDEYERAMLNLVYDKAERGE